MTEQQRPLAVVILAAGQGKRMGDPTRAKVLAELRGKPLLGYVLEQALRLQPRHVAVIVGHQRAAVAAYVADVAPMAQCFVQDQQLGTGHAVQQAAPALADEDADVVILSGDVPLLQSTTLRDLVARHQSSGATCTVLSTQVPNPTGYGRILRNAEGGLVGIVEHKDASDEQKEITEINSGIYCVQSTALFGALASINNVNAQGEYYLTDIVGILQQDGNSVEAWCAPRWEELHGINTVADLSRAEELLQTHLESA